jgi:hypothetical protein
MDKRIIDEEALMENGGLITDGETVEPVTGNEIPPGSNSENVRDDIPAQLSADEYIVPADVVRFFGVRFFEDLREQAKQGLQEMDADGRIGGTPVDAQGVPVEGQVDGDGEQLTPEEEQMLMEALGGTGMAYGGMVQQPLTTPYQDQMTLYQAPPAQGMNKGGLPLAPTAAPFDRSTFTLTNNNTGIEQRKYINPTTKEERIVNFMNGTPLGIIPEGFVPWTQQVADDIAAQTPETPVTTAPVQTERPEGSGRAREEEEARRGGTGRTGLSDEDAAALNANPYDFGMNALSNTGNELVGRFVTAAGGAALGPAGAVLGSVATSAPALDGIAKARAGLQKMEEAGLKGTPEYDKLMESINTQVKGLPGPARALANFFFQGDNYAKTPTTGTTTAPTGTTTGDTGGRTPAVTSGGAVSGGGAGRAGEGAGAKGTVSGQTLGFDKSVGKASTGAIGTSGKSLGYSAKDTGGKAATARSTNAEDYSMGSPAKEKQRGEVGYVGAQAKGGLVAKLDQEKVKKAKSKKGLAS